MTRVNNSNGKNNMKEYMIKVFWWQMVDEMILIFRLYVLLFRMMLQDEVMEG